MSPEPGVPRWMLDIVGDLGDLKIKMLMAEMIDNGEMDSDMSMFAMRLQQLNNLLSDPPVLISARKPSLFRFLRSRRRR